MAKCNNKHQQNGEVNYSWEISTPNEFGIYSSYAKLTDNSIFSLVNETVLESIYFQPRFRIRCVVHGSTFATTTTSANSASERKPLKSNYVEVRTPIILDFSIYFESIYGFPEVTRYC